MGTIHRALIVRRRGCLGVDAFEQEVLSWLEVCRSLQGHDESCPYGSRGELWVTFGRATARC